MSVSLLSKNTFSHAETFIKHPTLTSCAFQTNSTHISLIQNSQNTLIFYTCLMFLPFLYDYFVIKNTRYSVIKNWVFPKTKSRNEIKWKQYGEVDKMWCMHACDIHMQELIQWWWYFLDYWYLVELIMQCLKKRVKQ